MCGNPSHFQGDERNIVFLSLVDAPTGRAFAHRCIRCAGYVQEALQRSGEPAQDQLWVIHSMDRQAHLAPNDLRRRLLDHAHDPAHRWMQPAAKTRMLTLSLSGSC